VRTRTVDARSAPVTNVVIAARARSDESRTHLFYRLNGITIGLPPLRARARCVTRGVSPRVTDSCSVSSFPNPRHARLNTHHQDFLP
jgi:transcriptional regulator of aromatic amino acid metabolism